MNNKNIIIFTAVLFFVSAFVLAYVEKNLSDENLGKNWWVAYFVEPKSAGLDFVIENHSDRENFSLEVTDNKKKIYVEDGIFIQKGNFKEMKIDERIDKIENHKIIIIVSDGTNEKEIYKNY